MCFYTYEIWRQIYKILETQTPLYFFILDVAFPFIQTVHCLLLSLKKFNGTIIDLDTSRQKNGYCKT